MLPGSLKSFVEVPNPLAVGTPIRLQEPYSSPMLFQEPDALVILGSLPRARPSFYIKDPKELN